jgi:hypothetical protein
MRRADPRPMDPGAPIRTYRPDVPRSWLDSPLSRLNPTLLVLIVLSCGAARQPGPTTSAGARPEATVQVAPAPNPSAASEVEHWRARCDSGDQPACSNLAFLIEQKQSDVAARLYAEACEHDVPPACHNLGFMIYQRGDLGRAVPAFVKACSLSHAPACETLRSMMNAQAKKTGNRSCLEIKKKDGTVGYVCSNPASSGDCSWGPGSGHTPSRSGWCPSTRSRSRMAPRAALEPATAAVAR